MTRVLETQNPMYLTEAEVASHLRMLEVKHDLFQYCVDGYGVWQLLRSEAASRLRNLPRVRKSTDLKSKWLNRNIFLVLPEFLRFFFPRRARYFVRTVSSALREKEGKFFKDVYFDDLIKEFDTVYKMESINSPVYGGRRKSALIPAAMTTFTIKLLAELLARLPASSEVMRVAKQISSKLYSEPALSVFTPAYIGNVIRRFYWLKQLYLSLFRRVRPQYVLVASTGAGFPIWAAARELGIITIELQHGIYSHDHPDALPALAAPYKESLIVPDKIFLFGEYWLEELKKNQFYGHELISVGSPQIDHYRRLKSKWVERTTQNNQCIIVLTTQGLSRDNLIRFVSDFLKIAQGKLDYSFYIKLHPVYERDKSSYERVFGADPNVHILLGSDDPSTYDLLTVADFHLSVASASHYDALGLGVPTIVLPLPGYETVLNLVKSGHAYLARTPEDLLTFISNSAGTSVPPEVSAYYYTPNAVQNMMRELT